MRVWQGICLSAVVLFSFGSLCHAQSTPQENEYKQLIRVNEDIQPLGERPFGEGISLYDGSLSFTQTDVSLAGTGPLLQLVRQFDAEGDRPSASTVDPAFGDWKLILPHLETLTAGVPPSASNPTGSPMWNYNSYTQSPQKIYGWQIDNSTAPGIDLNARCSHFDVPPTVVMHLGGSGLMPWDPEEWWKGYHLVLPGESGQDMLSNVDTSTNGTYPVVTKSHWRFSCLPSTANGQPGEAFLGQAPDGTKYWFDMLVYRGAPGMTRPLDSSGVSVDSHPSSMVAYANTSVETLISVLSGSTMAHASPASDGMSRSLGVLLVTKVQDRFGNTLNYSYDANGYLTGITASDGRALSVTYVSGTPLIQSVTLQPSSGAARTWTYAYGPWTVYGASLTAVTLPDGTQWRYNLAGFDAVTLSSVSSSTCITLAVPANLGPTTGTIVHPSGLTGTFTVAPSKHGRSLVPRSCMGMEYNDPNTGGSYALAPDAWYSLTATQMTVSGAGLPSQTWSYNFSPSNDSWSDCAGTCPTTILSDVVAPDGSAVRHIFSNRFGMTESQLLRTEYYAGAAGSSTLLRAEDNAYAPPTTAPLPAIAGTNLQFLINADQTTKYSPLNQRVITQDGDTYTWQAEAFDVYAQVTQTKRSNGIAGQGAIEEATTYLNDPALWVLGLPQQVTNVTTGEIESANTYNTSNDTLLSRARFGQPLMSYTFNGQGQLASFTDGNSHTTSLSNYKRGIPQTIGYPDSTSESLVVDDFGQISTITDQAGHTTSYGYDNVGRITGITYPGGDEVAWLPKTFAYSFVTSDERGVPANHWRRTTTTGNAVGVTYFDAMLRPVLSDSDIGASVQASTLTTYDSKGQKIFSAYPSASALTFTLTPAAAGIQGTATTYDALERATQTQQNSELGTLTSSTAYLSGARQQVTDPKGNVTTTSYQVFDSPSYNAPVQVQAPAGITQTIARDLYGNPLSITQSGLYGTESDSVTKTLTYDAYHRLCRTTEPESGSAVMAYDGANNLAWSAQGLAITGAGCGQEQVAAAAQTARTYDAMNRVLTILAPAGTQSTQYHYTPLGQPDSMVSGISTWSGSYNYRGMLTGESLQLVGQNAWGIGYAHDAYGSLSLVHYPDGENVSYAPDALGRPTQAGSYASGIGYFPNGQVAQFAYGNGTGYVAAQNARQMLSNFSYGAGSTVQLSEDLSYDANGNITTVADLVAGGPRAKSFGYDALNRLTSANAAGLWGTQAYTYDALNNLRTLQTGSQMSTYHYDPTNKLASISNGATTLTSYLYDSRGNVTGKNAANLVFDQKNQLTQITGSDTYAYDASGRRVSKTAGGVTTYYFYSQAGQLMYQLAPGSALSTNFIYLGTKQIARNVVNVAVLTPSQVNVVLTLVGAPSLSSDGKTIQAVVDVANHGTATLTSSGAYPVHLGDHLIDSTGKVVTFDLDRLNIPDIPPGGHAAVSVAVGASQLLGNGNRMEFIPVQEGVAWFDSWGTAPLVIGPYSACSTTGTGSLCNTASPLTANQVNVILTLVSGPTLSADGQNVTSVVDINNQGNVTLSSSGTYPVNLGDHYVDASGKILVSDITRASIPDIAPGTHTAVTISVPSNGFLGTGRLLQFMPVQEGVTWFNAFGTRPITVGPYVTVLNPGSSSTGSYTVSWAGVGGATSYTLQEQVNGGAWNTVQANGSTSWGASGKGNGTYGYRVQACNGGGCGPWSGTSSTSVLLPPPAPASISAPASSSGIFTVTWATSATATSYTLQQSANGGGWTTVYSNAANGTTLNETATGSYTLRVQACNSGGCSAYATCNPVAVTIPPASAPTLSVPANSANGSYTASWSGVAGQVSYTLQEQVNGGGWTTVQTNGMTSWGTSGRGNGTYGYQVQACNAGGCGPWSSTSSVSVLLIPATPTGLSATLYATFYSDTRPPKTDYTLTLSWSGVAGASSYNFHYCQQSGTCYTTTTTATSIPEFTVVPGPTVSVTVQACNANGCSAWSASVAPTVVNQ